MPLTSMVLVGNVFIVFHCVQIRSGCLTLISNFIPFHSPPGFALIFFSFPSSLCLSLAFSAFPLVVLYFLKTAETSYFCLAIWSHSTVAFLLDRCRWNCVAGICHSRHINFPEAAVTTVGFAWKTQFPSQLG